MKNKMAKKAKPKNKTPSKKFEKYEVSNNKLNRKQTCPKCGSGTFLAVHKDRKHCGKCAYTVFETQEHKKEAPDAKIEEKASG